MACALPKNCLGDGKGYTLKSLIWVHDETEYRLLPCQESPCLWTVIPIRPGEDPSVKTSKEELTRGVVITYVDDLLLTGWQHHFDVITKALLAKYVMKRSGVLPEGKPETGSSSDGIDFLGARITRDDDGTVWCEYICLGCWRCPSLLATSILYHKVCRSCVRSEGRRGTKRPLL